MPVVTTTTLPDADQPVLGNGVEDEIAVDRQTQPTNYGDARWQVRETGASSWSPSAAGFDEGTVAFDTLQFSITGREDGEEYEVRLRTETEHRTGAWTSPVSIVTKSPGATGLQTTSIGQTSVALAWSDNSDNEDGFDVERRKQFASGFGPWRTLTTVGPNTTTYTDSTVSPGRTYQYRIRAFTDDTDAVSSSIQVTTSAADARQRDVPPEDWRIEIDHPDRDQPRTVQPAAGVEFRPRLNGLPEVAIPVRQADHWIQSAKWERQPMRVWRDGERLPITQLAVIRETPSQTTLIGRGGYRTVGRGADDIRQIVAREYTDTAVTTAIDEVLSDVGIPHTVDAAPSSSNELLATWDTSAEFRDNRVDTNPVVVQNDEVKPAQTGHLVSPVDISGASVATDATENWTTDEAAELTVGDNDSWSWTFDLDHAVPGEDVDIGLRAAYDEVKAYVSVYIDNTRVGTRRFSSPTPANKTVEWEDWDKFPVLYNSKDPPDLAAGQHTVTIETTVFNPENGGDLLTSTDGTIYLDTAAVVDDRVSVADDVADFTNTLDSNTKLDGPPSPYSPVDAVFEVSPLRRATGGRLEATTSSTANDWQLALAPTQGGSPTGTSTATTLEADFSGSVASWFATVTLGGVDATSQDTNVEKDITTHRTEPQVLSALTVKYDALSDASVTSPIENRAVDLITDLADRGNLLWELQWDPSIEDVRVVVTPSGKRTSDADPDLVDYEARRVDREVSQVTVRGSHQFATGESFTASATGTALANDRIQKGSERVYDPATGTVFVSEREAPVGSNGDYSMDYLAGEISLQSPSSMTGGDTYQIDYQHQPQATVARNVDFQNERIVSIPRLTTDGECSEAASFIVDAFDTPQWQADVTIPRAEAGGFDLIDVIDPSRLPDPSTDGYRIQSVDETAESIRLKLGPENLLVGDVVEDLQRDTDDVAREV